MPGRERSLVSGVTVDAVHARVLEDAFWVERLPGGGFRATVSVADGASLVPVGGIDDSLAFRQGLTVYGPAALDPGQRVPSSMLIPQISRRQASLLPGVERPVVAHVVDFSEDGIPLAFDVMRATLRSASKWSYEDFEWRFRVRDHLSPMVHASVDLARLLWRERVGRTGTPDWDAAFDADGNVRPGCPPGLLAQTVVHEYMVLTNICATEFIRAAGMPMIYRNQGPRPGGPAGRYEIVCQGHRALGAGAYGQFTDPLRRYTDLVNQRIAAAAIDGEPAPYGIPELAMICAEVNRSVQRAEVQARRQAAPPLPFGQKRRVLPLERMDPSAFRVAAQESGPLVHGNPCTAEFMRRLDDGIFTHADIAWIMFDARRVVPPGLRSEVFHRMTGTADEMAKVWEMASNNHNLPMYDGVSWKDGGHWVFRASLGPHAAEAVSQDPMRARGLALVRLAAGMNGVTLSPQPLSPGNGLMIADMFGKFKLVSLCRLMNWDGPEYVMEASGNAEDAHVSGYAEVRTDTFTYRSPLVHASAGRCAEAAASALALTALDPLADHILLEDAKRSGVDWSVLNHGTSDGRPLTALNSFCRQYGARLRCIWIAEQPSVRNFKCRAELAAGGNIFADTGTGASRTAAMEGAALNLIFRLLGQRRTHDASVDAAEPVAAGSPDTLAYAMS